MIRAALRFSPSLPQIDDVRETAREVVGGRAGTVDAADRGKFGNAPDPVSPRCAPVEESVPSREMVVAEFFDLFGKPSAVEPSVEGEFEAARVGLPTRVDNRFASPPRIIGPRSCRWR